MSMKIELEPETDLERYQRKLEQRRAQEAKREVYKAGIELLREDLKSRDKHDIDYLLDSGKEYEFNGEITKAILCYQKITELNPQHEKATACLVTALKVDADARSFFYRIEARRQRELEKLAGKINGGRT